MPAPLLSGSTLGWRDRQPYDDRRGSVHRRTSDGLCTVLHGNSDHSRHARDHADHQSHPCPAYRCVHAACSVTRATVPQSRNAAVASTVAVQ